MRHIKVRLDGFNSGRISGLKGLLKAGVNVVSVSDATHIDWHWVKRAKKRPRVN